MRKNRNKRFVVGDIHGAYLALLQVLEKSGFAYKKDLLICLGDVADGWSQVVECFEELLKVNNLVYILGNHDSWFLDWLKTGTTPYIWTSQGGDASIASYIRESGAERRELVKRHIKFLEKAVAYYVTEDNKLFVHGGFNWGRPIAEQDIYDLTWDRNLLSAALYWQSNGKKGLKEDRIKDYDEVFIGHTTTSRVDSKLLPLHASNVWALDQGAGWEGKLTIMDIDSKEFWQSDVVKTLYPNEHGR